MLTIAALAVRLADHVKRIITDYLESTKMLHRGKLFRGQASKTVAIVVPLYNRRELTPDEQISLKHLLRYLEKYDKYLIAPKSLDVNYPGFKIKRFDDSFFGSTEANTKLMFSPKFYKSFVEYKYILIYQLDALVFSDQLLEWCDLGFDYIGAPWLKTSDSPWVNIPRVGNGGFSLRKIESFLRVIYSNQYMVEPKNYWANFCQGKPKLIQYLNLPKKYLKYLTRFNGARWQMAHWHLRKDGRGNDDFFWSDEAIRYYSQFRIPPVEIGLRFSFEAAPRYCFELNHRKLPFGCHAWPRYDRKFWEPYLLK